MKNQALGLLVLLGSFAACSGDGDPGTTSGGGAGGGGGDGGSSATCTPGDTQACFDGEPGQIDVGICRAGSQSCLDDATWGACDDQVAPESEDCTAPGDEDCNGFSCSEPVWSVQFGASDALLVRGLAVGADGAVHVIGTFTQSMAPDGNTITSVGESDVFVVKLGMDGAVSWVKRFGTASTDQVDAIDVDAEGNIVIMGSATTPIDFGGGPIAVGGTRDIYIVRLDASGEHVASRHATTHIGDDVQWTMDPAGEKFVRDLVLLADGSIVAVGSYTGDWGCTGGGQCTPVNPTADTAAFIQKYTPDLMPEWRDTYDGVGVDEGSAIARGASDGVVWAGVHQGPILISATTLTNPGAFMLGTNATGTNTWLDKVDAVTAIRDVARTSDGSALMAMRFSGNTTMLGQTLTSDGVDGLVARYDSAGMLVSYVHPAGIGNDEVLGVTETGGGDVLLSGYYEGAFDVGGAQLPPPDPAREIFLASTSADCTHRWSKGFTGSSDGLGRLVATLPNGNVIMVGVFSAGDVDFGGGPLTAAVSDGFVASFQP